MRQLLAIGTAAALFAAGCSSNTDGASPQRLPDVSLVAALTPFDACDGYLDWVTDEALEQVGPYGMGGMGYPEMLESATVDDMAREAAPEATADASADTGTEAVAAGGESASTSTGTNNQEAQVDEADLVKTDGNRVVTVQNSSVFLTNLIDGAPYAAGSVVLGDNAHASQLFLVGDTAYVLGESWMPYDEGIAQTDELSLVDGGNQTATIWEVALGDTPSVADVRHIEGSITDGRMSNDRIRLVVSTHQPSGLAFVYPRGPNGEEVAVAANRDVITESELDDWIPSVTDGDGNSASLIDCANLYRPSEFSGLDMLSVITIGDGLDSMDATGVVSSGGTTYASADSLYVATTSWAGQMWFGPGVASPDSTDGTTEDEFESADHTDIHRFSLTGTSNARYASSGRVLGQPLNQYSMSEADGRLRIATTVTRWPNCPEDALCDVTASTESRVTILAETDNELSEVGMVDGLGPTETIRSVRYVGDLAYLVTFRQTDPFYVVDLADAANPMVLGELKIPGFSAYLHPVGDGMILGVGSDATDDGRITGAKVSLYDATDPTKPVDVANWTSNEIDFMVGSDSHAFHWDEARRQATLPYYGACFIGLCTGTNGALVMGVGTDSLTELARLDHSDTAPSPTPAPIPSSTTTTTTPTTSTTTTTTTSTTSTPASTSTTPATETPAAATSEDAVASTIAEPIPVDPGIGGPIEPAPPILEPLPGPEPLPYAPNIMRAFVIGDSIITVSEAGVAAHNADTFEQIGFARF